jgi:hypothetical protein
MMHHRIKSGLVLAILASALLDDSIGPSIPSAPESHCKPGVTGGPKKKKRLKSGNHFVYYYPKEKKKK